jgi:hypothetical protein
MAIVNKRIFDTDNALKGTFDGKFGKWQTLTYVCFAVAYAFILGWINQLTTYTSNFRSYFCFIRYRRAKKPLRARKSDT